MANYSGRGQQRRNEIARAKGFRNYNDYRKASKAVQAQANRAYEAAHPEYAKTGGRKQSAEAARSRTRAPRLVQLGGHRETISSMRARELYAFVRRAARAGVRRRGAQPVRVVLYGVLTFQCVDPEDGTETFHTVLLWPNYGYAAAAALAELREWQQVDPATGEIKPTPDVLGWLRSHAERPDMGAVMTDAADSGQAVGPDCELVRVQLTAETKPHSREAAA